MRRSSLIALLVPWLLAAGAPPARAADPLRIAISGDTEPALRESLMQAAASLESGPDQARYIELTVASEALHFFEVDEKPIDASYCSLDEGDGGRRIDGVSEISVEGATDEHIRYFLTFKLEASDPAPAAPWTDLACQYQGSAFALMLRGHFVAKNLRIVEGYDVVLTAVAP